MKKYIDYSLIEQLNKRKGEKVWYRGCWGCEDPEPAIFKGAEYADEKDDIVISVDCENGDKHWGYTHQIEFMEK